MEHIPETIARLNPFDKPIVVNGKEFDRQETQQLIKAPLFESMFTFIANARSLLMFDKKLFDVEIISGRDLEVNWVNRFRPAPSDYAPLLLDVWEFDIRRSAVVTENQIDITDAVTQWKDFAQSQEGVLHPEGLVEALLDIELETSNLTQLSQGKGRLADAVFDLINTRTDMELGSLSEQSSPDKENTLTRGG